MKAFAAGSVSINELSSCRDSEPWAGAGARSHGLGALHLNAPPTGQDGPRMGAQPWYRHLHTGLLAIAGALGIVLPQTHHAAGLCLCTPWSAVILIALIRDRLAQLPRGPGEHQS
jgi:hypothetical protein